MLLGLMINTKKNYNSNNHISIEWNAHFMGWCIQHATWACWDIQSAYFTLHSSHFTHSTFLSFPISFQYARTLISFAIGHMINFPNSLAIVVYVGTKTFDIFSFCEQSTFTCNRSNFISKIDFIFDKFSEKCDDEMLT